jgi:lipopolysaccharide transport system ATP-binding protein
MSDAVMRVEHVSKQYRIGRPEERNDSLREAVTRAVSRSLRDVVRGRRTEAPRLFWALRDVSFDVRHGEVLGIIGRNGAGKSTLLKVLSRITHPTSGRVEAYGRVGSLLEVGTGFHPELTGRDNIYLNGSILGMRKAEVDRKFDEIVDFSGVEMFLDTPVKRYSSGMYVRLAFAVAAHLEPEILIVDEVLAVGDVDFQKRCLRKMEGVARGGRTVLLVSHNMSTVQAFCTRAILLRDGAIVATGAPADTVSVYLRGLEEVASADLLERADRDGDGRFRFTRCRLRADGVPTAVVAVGRPAAIEFELDGFEPGVECAFTIYDQLGRSVSHFNSSLRSSEDMAARGAVPRFSCEMDEMLLVPGRYRIDAAIWSGGQVHDHFDAAAVFDVEEGLLRGRPMADLSRTGETLIPHRWTLPA